MKNRDMLLAIGVCLVIFVAAPYLPNAVLKMTVGTTVGTFILLAAATAVLRMNAVLGLGAFLATAALFLENRRRVISKIKKVAASPTSPQEGEYDKALEPADDLVDNEVHPEHEKPQEEEHGFDPERDAGSNTFERVGDSINEKGVLSSAPKATEDAVKAFENSGLAEKMSS